MKSLHEYCNENIVKSEEGESLCYATFDSKQRLIVAKVNCQVNGEFHHREDRKVPPPKEKGSLCQEVTIVWVNHYYFLAEGDEVIALKVAARNYQDAWKAVHEAEALLRCLTNGAFSDRDIEFF